MADPKRSAGSAGNDDSRRPTLRDVALTAGVSVTTASRALARRGDVTAATRARVVGAAEQLGYSRADTTHGRPPVHPRNVDLVVGFSGEWTDRVVKGAWRASARLGLDLTVRMDRPGHDEDWPRRITPSQCAGVVFGLIQPVRSDIMELREAQIPVVVLGPISEPDVAVARVETTDWEGGYLAGELLVRRGATRFISVLGRPAYPFGRARDEGFRAAVEALSPRARVDRVDTVWTEVGPIAGVTSLLVDATERVGLFACNDAIALRCYLSAAVVGAEVGHDLLVVGFDDGPHAASANPSLTTVHQPLEAMAARAVEIIAETTWPSAETEHAPMPVHLVERASTSPNLVLRGSKT